LSLLASRNDLSKNLNGAKLKAEDSLMLFSIKKLAPAQQRIPKALK
jgi:hypothetical protein